jgi:hypothetical protein
MCIAEDKRKLAAITEEKKAIATARLKDLNTKKKEMGRIPRHSTSRSVASTSAIPRFVGHAEDSGSGKLVAYLSHQLLMRTLENSDSNMELDFPAPASLFASTSLVPSSPGMWQIYFILSFKFCVLILYITPSQRISSL